MTTAFKKGKPKVAKNLMNRFEQCLESGLSKKEVPVSFGRIYASSAGMCSRQTATVAMIDGTVTKEQHATSEFYFRLGSATEEVFKKGFQQSDIYLADEIRVESIWPEIPISGRIDFILRDPKTKQPIITELKTCGKLPEKPKLPHLSQLKTYMALCGQSRGLLWYMSRNVGSYDGKLYQRCFEVEFSDEEKIKTLTTLAKGSVYNSHNLIPPIPNDMKKYKCGFCPLIKFCWEDEPMQIKGTYATIEQQAKLAPEIERIVHQAMLDQDELNDSFLDHSSFALF